MPPSSPDVGRTKPRLLLSGRAWIAIAVLGSAAGLASITETTPSGAAIHSSTKSALCGSFDTLGSDLLGAPGSQVYKAVANLGEVAAQYRSSRAVTQEGTELGALANASSLTGAQLLNATKAIASACGHALGADSGSAPSAKPANVKTVAIPSSMHLVQPPAGTPGPETVPIPNGPALATLHNAVTGTTVDGVQCEAGEQTVSHVHTHLTIFVNGQARVVPYGIGIPGDQAVSTKQGDFVETGSCFYWLHTHADDGVIHVESPSSQESFTLGQFFDEWGIPLSTTRVGPATGKVTVFFTAPGQKARLYEGNPRNLPLGSHYQIQLDVGSPIVAPVDVTNWGGL
jgi:hypothetical protein